jgi:N-dimethylarginine dimethylaminohydrolase
METAADPPEATFLMSAPRCAPACLGARAEGREIGCAFRVAWEINPHMRLGSVEPVRAAGQHRSLAHLLHTLGAKVETIPFVHGAHDSVFVKDNALLVRRDGRSHALLAQPRFAERRMEQGARGRALGRRGFRVRGDARAPFEGGDLVILPRGEGALLGTGFRSDARALHDLTLFLGTKIHALELRDPRLYHLDTAFTALGDGTIAFCPEAFTAMSRRWIERTFPGRSLLRVPYADACNFALNTIEVGHHVLLGGPSRWLEARLRERGWSVHVPDLTQFRRAGGSAACLVSRVHLHPGDVTSSTTAAMRSTAA